MKQWLSPVHDNGSFRGRQFDGISSILKALPETVKAVAGEVPVHFDGGIRRGTDIFEALALGADFCFIESIAIWASSRECHILVKTHPHLNLFSFLFWLMYGGNDARKRPL